MHEFIEYTLIKSAGIDPILIDKFDMDKASPEEFPEEYAQYEKFHDIANLVERQFIENLGLNWEEHDKVVNTVKVNTAVETISEELHKENPDEHVIERATEDVKEEIGDTLGANT